MTSLRKRMIRELQLHRKSPRTVEAYVAAVAQLAMHYDRSPEKISLEEIRDFLHHLIAIKKLAYSSVNQKLAGIRFFWHQVLQRKNLDLRVPAKRSGTLPEALGRSEIARLIDAAICPKHRTLMMTCHATGPSRPAARQPWADSDDGAMLAAFNAMCTTVAATATVPSANRWPRPLGFERAKTNCCRCRTSTTCLRYRTN